MCVLKCVTFYEREIPFVLIFISASFIKSHKSEEKQLLALHIYTNYMYFLFHLSFLLKLVCSHKRKIIPVVEMKHTHRYIFFITVVNDAWTFFFNWSPTTLRYVWALWEKRVIVGVFSARLFAKIVFLLEHKVLKAQNQLIY